MTGKTARSVYLCVGDERPGPRVACPNTLHDWPLPTGYIDASLIADSRIARGWKNKRCPDCGKYGWMPGQLRDGDIEVPPQEPTA